MKEKIKFFIVNPRNSLINSYSMLIPIIFLSTILPNNTWVGFILAGLWLSLAFKWKYEEVQSS